MPQPRWRYALPVALAAALAGGVGIAAGWFAARRPPPAAQVTRFLLPLPEGQSFPGVSARAAIALSPDGREIVYTTQAGLFRRSMSDMQVHAIRGTEHFEMVSDPVFSPDGQSLLFYARSDQTIKRIAIGGGTAVTICRAEGPFGISWTTDGIVFGQGRQGIMRVSAEGGTPALLVAAGDDEELHGPQLLPGGRPSCTRGRPARTSNAGTGRASSSSPFPTDQRRRSWMEQPTADLFLGPSNLRGRGQPVRGPV